ncbi:MAG: hypothetical protein ACP5HU_03990 [Phycisphaerae bacterium]
MTKKFRLLLLDACVVIELFKRGIWEDVLDRCEIHLARTVVDEAHFYEDDLGERHYFDLLEYEADGKIAVFDVPLTEIRNFLSRFGPSYMESLHDGEAESLAYLFNSSEPCLICSADKIVYRVLGNTNKGEQGISLQEILEQVGLGRKLSKPFGKQYREYWTGKGMQEGLRDQGWQGL